MLCEIAGRRSNVKGGQRVSRTTELPVRSLAARQAVLYRSEGDCENPRCSGDIQDTSKRGLPLLEVDHIHDLADGGPDFPTNMIALCPNCHTIKTHGSTGNQLRPIFLKVAKDRHEAMRRPSSK